MPEKIHILPTLLYRTTPGKQNIPLGDGNVKSLTYRALIRERSKQSFLTKVYGGQIGTMYIRTYSQGFNPNGLRLEPKKKISIYIYF